MGENMIINRTANNGISRRIAQINPETELALKRSVVKVTAASTLGIISSNFLPIEETGKIMVTLSSGLGGLAGITHFLRKLAK